MGRRAILLVATWVGPSAVLAGLAAAVASRVRIPPPERLDAAARAAVVECLRAGLDGRQVARPGAPQLERRLAQGGPVVVTVWREGAKVAVVTGGGERIADAIADAAQDLGQSPPAHLSPAQRRTLRLQVDVVSGRGPLLRDLPPLSLFSVHPGIDGVGARAAGEDHLLLPDDLVRAHLLQTSKPVRGVPDVGMGLDAARLDRALAASARITPAAWARMDRSYFRFRTDSFVEAPAPADEGAARAAPLPLTRGAPPAPPLTAAALRAAAVAGGRYLVAHLAQNGRYVYEEDLTTGRGTDPTKRYPYSLPRHAGTTYFLAELYHATGEAWLREPIERAFAHLVELVEEGRCTGRTPAGRTFACVHEGQEKWAQLGSTALAVVALCEYRRATSDPRYDELTRKLGEWILLMQRADGSFAHRYEVATGRRDEVTQQLYYSGEAALALVRLHAVYRDPRYLAAAERALDDQVRWYDFFAGGFFFGEDHWTCIASQAVWPALKKDSYLDFCEDYGVFLRRQQMREDDFADQADLAGTYGATPFVIPNNTPVGSRSEAMISTYLLGVEHGRPSADLREQILRSMRFALSQQVRPDGMFAVSPAAQGDGALTASAIDRTVRIDYVQHVCSAMLRVSALLDAGAAR